MKTSLKPALPRQVRIVGDSALESSFQEKCQLLPAHLAAISQQSPTQQSPLKSSQIGYVAKKKSESDIISTLILR